jgi:hypothetical protein
MTALTRRDALKTGASLIVSAPALAGITSAASAAAGQSVPLAELASDAGDYDLSIWLSVNLDRYPQGIAGDVPPTVSRDFVLEACRSDGAWNLRVSPWDGSIEDGDVSGPPVVELRDQTAGADPFTLLRALLSGQPA